MRTFDYIIVGAGSAGCVLANRLSADPGREILLLEAGGRDSSIWLHVPVGYVKTMDMARVNWLFHSEPEAATGGREIPVPRGKVLGGSSSINGMLYVRGQARDYDGWAQMGNRGWSYADVLPYFKRSEHREGGGSEYHGVGGPLNVADTRETYELLDRVIEAAEECGYPRNPDYNGASQEGFGYYQVTQRNGRRHSAAGAFLDPVRRRRNLRIETRAHATRVLLENGRAAGVSYGVKGEPRTARARREVLLCAGAVQSPQLLELSGIGAPDRLEKHGIEVVHPLPGVGENLQDHYIVRIANRINRPITLNEKLRGIGLVGEVLKYAVARRGALSLTAGIVYGFVRTRPEVETPDVQYHIAHATFRDAHKRVLDRHPGLTIAPCVLRPESRGSIHVGSSDPFAAPVIRPNFLAAQRDRDTLVAGLRVARDLARSKVLGAYVEREDRPGPECRSGDGLLEYARQTGATLYHPVGTCRMGSDEMAVVDDALRVRGIDGLRVVDASVMPTLTSGNTNAPTVMIAEKGADLIAGT